MKEKSKTIVRLIAVIVLVISLGILALHTWDSIRSRQTDDKLNELKQSEDSSNRELLPEYSALYKENPDTIGWLKIDGTEIDNVVMQAPDVKDKYLHLDFYGEYSYRGCLFLAEKCDIFNSDNLIISGHNMKDGSMFGTLPYYGDEAFYKEHKTFTFDTIYEKQTYEVVAAIRTAIPPADVDTFRYYSYTEANYEKKFEQYVDFIEQNKIYDTGIELHFGDKLLTLTTCAYHTTDGRFVVVARKLPS